MTIEESGNHCAGCGAGIRSYLDDIAKAEKEANELSKKEKIPVAVYKTPEGNWLFADAFYVYSNGLAGPGTFVVSKYL